MSDNWLQIYLIESIDKNICLSFCTTCGAMEFRSGVLAALAQATGQPQRLIMDEDSARSILNAMAGLKPIDRDQAKFGEAFDTVLSEVRITIGDAEMRRFLGQHWSRLQSLV